MDTEKIERMFEEAWSEQAAKEEEKYPKIDIESMSDVEVWLYYTKRGAKVYG